MTYFAALGAALGAAISNGAAANLEKVSTGQEREATSLDPRFLFRLLVSGPYACGILLDLIGLVCTVAAVRDLPLFFVQSIIAASIVVTAILDRLFLRQVITKPMRQAIFLILAGLVCLGLTATSDKTNTVSAGVRFWIEWLPVPMAMLAAFLVRLKTQAAAIAMASVAGIGFGATSVIGRIIVIPHDVWRLASDPLAYSLAAYGFVGIMLFSIALQRASATSINAAMTAVQTVAPTLVGIAILGDTARHGLWSVVSLGIALTLAGTMWLALKPTVPLRATEKSR